MRTHTLYPHVTHAPPTRYPPALTHHPHAPRKLPTRATHTRPTHYPHALMVTLATTQATTRTPPPANHHPHITTRTPPPAHHHPHAAIRKHKNAKQ